MKKTIILAILILISLTSQSQNEKKWKFGIKFLANNNLSSEYLVTDGNINGYSIKYDKFNYTIGLISEYKLKTRFIIQTGIEYSNKDFTGIYNCATCFPIPWEYPKETINQRFIQIPIGIKYYIIDKKIKLSIKTGLNNNFSVKNKLENKKYYLEGILESEIEYEIIDKWNLGLGFQYNKSLTDLYDDKNFNIKSNGIFLNVIYGID
jgi:hypothetical protein